MYTIPAVQSIATCNVHRVRDDIPEANRHAIVLDRLAEEARVDARKKQLLKAE